MTDKGKSSSLISDKAQWIEEYIEGYLNGDDDAFHNLMEAPKPVIDRLRSSWVQQDAQTRNLFIEVIWQQRDPADIPLLLAALDDEDDDVWKQALDGLVTLKAATELRQVLSNLADSDPRFRWIIEALSEGDWDPGSAEGRNPYQVETVTRDGYYSVYTTAFDVETTGRALTGELTSTERKVWKQQVAVYQAKTERMRTETSLGILGQIGLVGGYASFDPSQTVVSVLVDHSGSLRGQKAIIACLLMELVSDFLSRLGVRYEILGFTTVDWRGGKSRELWLTNGKPKDPGRLNDLLHIVYRDASETTPGAPYATRHILREELLKENIDGEALNWASERLKKLDAENKLILVIADGVPVDDATLSVNPGNFLERHLLSVAEDISTTPGFKLAGIGIDYNVGGNNVKIDRLDQISRILPEFLASLFA